MCAFTTADVGGKLTSARTLSTPVPACLTTFSQESEHEIAVGNGASHGGVQVSGLGEHPREAFNVLFLKCEISSQQTSKPRTEPVVITVEEPVQDPGENCAVIDGCHLLLIL